MKDVKFKDRVADVVLGWVLSFLMWLMIVLASIFVLWPIVSFYTSDGFKPEKKRTVTLNLPDGWGDDKGNDIKSVNVDVNDIEYVYKWKYRLSDNAVFGE